MFSLILIQIIKTWWLITDKIDKLIQMTHLDSFEDFIKVGHLYKLGFLPTEMQHPLTVNLADSAKTTPEAAADMFSQLDQNALDSVLNLKESIEQLRALTSNVLDSKGRIFICGCGATGRLALTIESYFRQLFPDLSDKVIGFMAGGDIALVHSLEGFEDQPEYGSQHLKELGFTKSDLMIGVTEGGETPYVLGAIEEASKISDHQAYMICCNPKDILANNIERSRKLIENTKVNSIHIETGPMALAGSTRLQATTALMAFLGLSLLTKNFEKDFKTLKSLIKPENYKALIPLVIYESDCYKDKKYVHYEVSNELALTVFTDTTERSPTFSTPSFEPTAVDSNISSWCYISIINNHTVEQAWHSLLHRPPSCLNWSIDSKTSKAYLEQFDFSEVSKTKRANRLKKVVPIKVYEAENKLYFNYQDHELTIPSTETLWIKNLLLKTVMNFHSTVLMCRLDRVESNMMTWVRPSNGKLIDRATRYLVALANKDTTLEYNDALQLIIEQKKWLKSDESIILKARTVLQNSKLKRLAT